ncbi:MAG: hypothetical protein ACRDSL_13360 [Pseudonocardiaceae bacterium]
MPQNPFAGTWTYRSFHNKPEPVDSFDEIRFAQAELTLEENGLDLLSGRLSFGDDYLRMSGTVQSTDPPTVRLQATGVEDTATAGWTYDYLGYLTPRWPEGDAQRPAIIGTVIRTLPHEPERPAGYSGSFVAVSRDRPAAPYELPESVVTHFADRLHRLHHSVWHGLRNGWDVLSATTRSSIDELGWTPPRPARQYVNGIPKRPYITNGSGEDFLYFHREMIVQYHALMAEAGAEPVVWVEIPQPGHPRNEVPPAWEIAGLPTFERRIAALKSDEFYWSRMRWWDQCFKDPTYLATLTLGELGALLEFSVHNDMHIRWSALPRDPDTNAPLPTGRPGEDFSIKWDNPRYNTLLEFYSSHVNPIFWRLHGWIDDRIADWYEAHESVHPGEVLREKCGAVEWFEPGRWVQVARPWVWPEQFSDGNSHDHNHDHTDDHPDGVHSGRHGGGGHHVDPEERQRRIESMEQVLAILYSSEITVSAAGVSAEPAVSFDRLVLKMPI